MNQATFASLNLEPRLVENLESLGYVAMTPIQAQSLPDILAGKDVIGQARTGSGKTAAFGLGLLHKLKVERFRIQALVLCPTRELADQVTGEIRRLGRGIHNIKVLTLCGGTAFGPQLGSLEHGAHIIVGTPGRVEEHLRKGSLKLPELKVFVLDEADRMLDMGFQPALDAIIPHLPKVRQTLLFSATYPDEIRAIAKRVMVDPLLVQVASSHDTATIEQLLYQVDDNAGRTEALQLLLLHYRPDSALVFCNTKRETQAVADELAGFGFVARALHGDLEQRDRDETLVQFANKSTSVLVATDVAARGLDIEAIDTVINYHVPRELEVYIHRIGRTARAGSKGVACTLFTEKETRKIARLEEYLGHALERTPLPSPSLKAQPAYKPSMVTLQIDGGRKQKLRPGDILGALTGTGEIAGSDVGKIRIFDQCAYVAIKRQRVKQAEQTLSRGNMKGRPFRVRQV